MSRVFARAQVINYAELKTTLPYKSLWPGNKIPNETQHHGAAVRNL